MRVLDDVGGSHAEKRAVTEQYLEKASKLEFNCFDSECYDPKYICKDPCDEIMRAWQLRGGGGR